MLSRLFDRITRLSVRWRWATIAFTLMILLAGGLALDRLNQEMLPPIEFPQTVVLAPYGEAESAQEVLEEVTIPLEESLGAIEGVVNVESTTNPSLSLVIVRNEFGLNQDRIVEEIEAAIDATDLPADMEDPPQVLNFSFDDLPVVVASVSSADLTLPELKARVESELKPQLEALDQVSEVSVGGGQELPDPEPVETTAEIEPEPEPTPEPEPLYEPITEPSELDFFLVRALREEGLEIATAQEVTPEMARALLTDDARLPQVLRRLSPENLRALDPEVLAALPSNFVETLDPELQSELDARAAEYGGVGQFSYAELREANAAGVDILTGEPLAPPVEGPQEGPDPDGDPLPLPESWIAAAGAQGLEIATTADLTPQLVAGIASFAPELLADLTPEMVARTDPEALAAIPEDALESLDPAVAGTIAEIIAAVDAVTPDPVALPESWIAAAGAQGLEIATTADLTPELVAGIASFAPQLLGDLTPEMVAATDPVALQAIPGDALAELEPELATAIAERLSGGEPPGAVPLPDSWIAAAGAQGLEIATTADLNAGLVAGIAGFAPQLLADLTPEMVAATDPEALVAIPPEALEDLEPALAGAIAARVEGVEPAEPADPEALPPALVQGLAAFGLEIERASEVEPDLIRQLGALGEPGLTILGQLTPANLRALPPESIALLPPDFVATLDADLRAELDALATGYDGAGALAVQEAEEAAELAASSPALEGVWLEPNAEGDPSEFTTAADLINNPFAPSAAEFLNFFPVSPNADRPAERMAALTPEVISWLADNEEGFVETLSPQVLELMSPETITFMLEEYPTAFDAELTARLEGIAEGEIEVFVPETTVTRTDGNSSVTINVFKDGEANTVVVAERVFETLDAYEAENAEIDATLVFEQASFITDSIEGVAREGVLGAIFAVLVILVFLSGHVGGRYQLNWRAMVITGVSIPASILFAFLLMRWLPPTAGRWFSELAESSNNDLIGFVARLFPTDLTLNIMTLSGLTVAIGRIVDDSIVVLENIYRFMQRGDDPLQAVIAGTREVAVAIFSATVTTMAVFLPLGLLGGVIGAFFLPFGLTVTYALAASYIVSITIVPALAYLMIRPDNLPEERESWMQRAYTPSLVWALRHRLVTMIVAGVIFFGSLGLLARLPQSFIPSIGEAQITASVTLPSGTGIVETNALVEAFEARIDEMTGIRSYLTEVGSGGGFEAIFGGGGVAQNAAVISISVEDNDEIDALEEEVRAIANTVFGEEQVVVSAGTQNGDFGAFNLILTGVSLEELRTVAPDVKEALATLDADEDGTPDLANVSSNLDALEEGGGETIIRIDGRPAASFAAELQTTDTIGVTSAAQERVRELQGLPAAIEVTEGFDSQQQTEGFQSMVTAIGYSIIIVYVVMAFTFGSLVHPFTILFSLPFALVGAAVALYFSDSVLGISAMVGLLMLVGIVVTNGIVLMDLVQQLRARGVPLFDALVEAGRTRLRPIWMTALTAILALIPLALSEEGGAIIAAELATTVIGGLLVSTLLTLVVIPVVYSLLDSLGRWTRGLIGRGTARAEGAAGD